MPVTGIDGARQIIDGTITNAEIASGAAIALTKLAEAVLQADGGQALTANLPAGGFKITGAADGTSASDYVTRQQLDSVAAGLDWKTSVKVATTAAGTLASSFENTDVVDGITIATGDRILVKNQASGAENGIYTVNASGSPTRATDADANAEVTGGLAVFVEQGTVNADTGWVVTNNGTVNVGTDAWVFAQFTGGQSYTAGAGLTLTGSVIDVVSANTGIAVGTDNLTLTLAANSLLDITSGLRLARGTSGQIIVVDGSTNPVMVAMSGDATIAAGGAVTVASTITRNANLVVRETPSGLVNGSNTSYTLANTPVASTEEVFLNGLLQEPGAGNDYTISGATITYLTAPLTGDRLRVSYRK